MVVNLQTFTSEDLWKIRRAAAKTKSVIKCKLCRCSFRPSNSKQRFDAINCRVRYWQLKKEIGEIELDLRLDHLEQNKEIGDAVK